MKNIRKYALMFMAILMCVTSLSVNVYADDEVIPEEPVETTYTASYEFVLDS